MQKFTTLRGVAAPMPMINIDTDMIIPKQFLKTIKRTGLGKNLFDELRYEMDGKEKPDFVLNQPAYRKAQILVAGENFGCGSSREHAPWALLDYGIRKGEKQTQRTFMGRRPSCRRAFTVTQRPYDKALDPWTSSPSWKASRRRSR